jgi:hypothetical protein
VPVLCATCAAEYATDEPPAAAVVARIADDLGPLSFDRSVGNVANTIDTDGARVVADSARRHMAG